MQGELTGRHGSLVRLPGQLALGQTLKEDAGDWRLSFEFGEEGFCE
jgi:hypothetical protein